MDDIMLLTTKGGLMKELENDTAGQFFDKQIKQVEKGNEDLKDTINRLKEDKKYLRIRLIHSRGKI